MPYRDDVEALRLHRDRLASELVEAKRRAEEARRHAEHAASLALEFERAEARLALLEGSGSGPGGVRVSRSPVWASPRQPLRVALLVGGVHVALVLAALLRPHPVTRSWLPPVGPSLSVDTRVFAFPAARSDPAGPGLRLCRGPAADPRGDLGPKQTVDEPALPEEP